MLTSLIVVIILQYLPVSSRHNVHLEDAQCDMSIITQSSWQEKPYESLPFFPVQLCSVTVASMLPHYEHEANLLRVCRC